METWGDRFCHLGITSVFAITGFSVGAIGFDSQALAQSNIAPDETLAEDERSVVTPNFNGTPNEVITGGATRERNLFHSFREFNVDAERGAYFFSPDGIANILSRVTGENPSAINGILGTFGIDGDTFVRSGANLFLINPNGIIFGPEARLDLGGSFMATTADGIQFGEAGFFSATNPDAPSQLLTVDPSAFFFNQLNPPASIINQSQVRNPTNPDFIDGLRVDDGRSLLLLGGEIQLLQGKLFASSGRVELGAVTGGTVGLTIDDNALDLTFPVDLQLGNISLLEGTVDASGIQSVGTAGGDIQLQGDQITLATSAIGSYNYSNQPNGTLSLQANQLSLTGSTIDMSGTQVFSSAGGTIQFESDQVTLANSTIQSNNYSDQSNGTISMQVGSLNSTNSFIRTNTFGSGTGGNINIVADTINLQDGNGSGISTSSQSQGRAGNIDIRATDAINLNNQVSIASSFNGLLPTTGSGSSGNISITTGSLNIQEAGIFSVVLLGGESSGTLTIRADDSINLNRANLFTSSLGNSSSGHISITTGDLKLANGSNILTSAIDPTLFDTANLDPRLYTPESIAFIRQRFAGIEPGSFGQGDSGNIAIFARGNIQVTDGSTITTSTVGQGQGGNLNVTADSIELDGTSATGFSSSLSSSTQSSGNAGNVVIDARQLRITNGAAISTSAFRNSSGQGGDITVIADSIELDGTTPSGQFSSGLFSSTQSSGNAGDVSVATEQLRITNGATISTSAEANSSGDGGTLNVTADSIELDGISTTGVGSSLSSSTQGSGDAGNVAIDAGQLRITGGAAISTSAFRNSSGDGGTLNVTADSIELDGTTPSGQFSSGLFSSTQSSGNAGDVFVTTEQLRITNGATISTSAEANSSGDGGNLNVTADSIELDGTTSSGQQLGSSLSSSTQGSGDAGNVIVDTDQLRITGGGTISTGTLLGSSGQGGDITITADAVELIGTAPNEQARRSNLASETLGSGNAGNVSITADQLRIRGGALISTRSFGRGSGGNLTVNATDSIELSGTSANGQSSSGLFSSTAGAGQAGNLRVETGDLRIQDGAQISASTLGAGQGGNIRVIADTIDLSGTSANRLLLSAISSETYSLAEDAGDAGRINITARELRVHDRAGISTSTFGQGNAGNIIAQVRDRIALSNRGFISSSVAAGAIGNSGSITLRTGSLSATGGSQIAALVSRERRDQQGTRIAGGRGRGGSIDITASNSIRLSGTNADGFSSGILTLSERGASGPAGDITLRTSDFRIANGAIVVASTFNDGEGGSIVINADNFEATEGGQVVTSTRGAGSAGEITLNVTGDVLLSGRDRNFQNRRDRTRRYTNRPGQSDRVSDVIVSQGANSGLFANTEGNSMGDGGSITLNARNLSLTDRATISAQSQGTGNAGNVNLNLTESVNATDGNIITSTSSENASGGDITLLASDVRLFGDSDIRTDVQGQGGGGNITVAADYVVAFDDSDILAYSVGGSGGNIALPAFFGENYFGANDRSENDSPSRDELNALDRNSQVNVDASGQVSSGTITTPDTSFIQNSLSELPESAIDSDTLLANSCVVRSQNQSGTFTITGTGGLPQRPGDAPLPAYSTNSVRSVAEDASAGDDRSWQMGDPIVEPQGMYQLEDGRMVLSRECP